MLEHATIATDLLVSHQRNYRKHPPEQLAKLEASLRRFNQVRSIVVQPAGKKYVVVAGHGVVDAARRVGLAELAADIIPASWDARQVEGYLAADNMGGADDDLESLLTLLREQEAEGFTLESLGFTSEELDGLLAELEGETDEDGQPRTRSTNLEPPQALSIEPVFSVLVECSNETDQQRAYEYLTQGGFPCRILTL